MEPKQPERTPNQFNESNTAQAAEVANSLISSMAPAERGWILGFVFTMCFLVGTNMWVSIKTLEATGKTGERTQEYFEKVEANRASAMDEMAKIFTDISRRNQETIRELTKTVSRDSERAGIAAMTAIEDRSESIQDATGGK